MAYIRNTRIQKNIAQKEPLALQLIGKNDYADFNSVVTKFSNLSSIEVVDSKTDGSVSFMVKTSEYALPLGHLINVEEELAKLRSDLAHYEGFLQGVLKKLSNERFVQNANPDIVARERKKQQDAESKIATIKEMIASLTK